MDDVEIRLLAEGFEIFDRVKRLVDNESQQSFPICQSTYDKVFFDVLHCNSRRPRVRFGGGGCVVVVNDSQGLPFRKEFSCSEKMLDA